MFTFGRVSITEIQADAINSHTHANIFCGSRFETRENQVIYISRHIYMDDILSMYMYMYIYEREDKGSKRNRRHGNPRRPRCRLNGIPTCWLSLYRYRTHSLPDNVLHKRALCPTRLYSILTPNPRYISPCAHIHNPSKKQ